MADDDTKSNVGAADAESERQASAEPRGPKVPKPPSPPKSFTPLAGPSLPVIFGQNLGGGASVTSVMVDGREYGARENPQIEINSKIEVFGKNLDVFNEWQIQQTGRNPINLDEPVYEGGYKVIFMISKRLADRLVEGANFGISLFASKVGGRRRILPLVFVFQTKAEDKDKEKQKAAEQAAAEQARQASATGAGAGAGFDLPGMFVQSGGDIMAGAAGGLAAGLKGGKQAAKPSQPVKTVEAIAASGRFSGGPSAGSAGADVDYDIEGQESVESIAGGGVATRVGAADSNLTGAVQAGGQTISQGGTARVGGKTISAGGTVQGGAQISERGATAIAAGAGAVSGGGGVVRASGQAPAGRAVSDIDAKTSVSGEVKAPASEEIKVEGQVEAKGSTEAGAKGELRQKAQVGAEADLKAGAGITAEAQGTVQAPSQASQAGISGTAGAGRGAFAGGTTGLGVNLESGSTPRTGFQGQSAMRQAETEPSQPSQAKIGEEVALGKRAEGVEKGETGGDQIRGAETRVEPSKIGREPGGLGPKIQPEEAQREAKGERGAKGEEEQGEPQEKVPPKVQEQIDKLKRGEKPLPGLTSRQLPPGSPAGVPAPPAAVASPGVLGEKIPPGQTMPAKEAVEPSFGKEGTEDLPEKSQAPPAGPPAGEADRAGQAGKKGEKMPQKAGPPLPSKPEEKPTRAPAPLSRKDLRAKKLPTFGKRFGGALAKQKLLGKASGRLWDIAAGTAYAGGFTFLGFYLGMLGMDAYWIAHWRAKDLFPMAIWKKIVTVLTNILGIGVPLVLVLIIWYTGCNYPSKGRLSVIGFAYPSACEALDGIASAARGAFSGSIPPPQAPPGALCAPVPVGPASPSALAGTCFGQNAAAASIIAGAESGGDPGTASRVDVCTGDGAVVSWGLFQINLSAHAIGGLDCPRAFSKMYTGSNRDCRVVNQALYQQCVQAASDPSQNIQRACEISGQGSNWNAWALTKNKCGL